MSAETILTLASGRGIDLLEPTAADVDFEAYAEQLAKEPRYNGATPGVILSVAQHACMCADAALDETGDRVLAAYLLLHDHHEAVMKDDTTPKKRAIAAIAEQRFGVLAANIMEAFALLTYRHDAVIHEAAGLPWPIPSKLQPMVKRYDLRAFVTEWHDLMPCVEHPNWKPYDGVPQLGVSVPLTLWDWRRAKSELLRRCHELLPALQGAR
jgi:hypothetical protein